MSGRFEPRRKGSPSQSTGQLFEKNGTRRSSSISADQVRLASQQTKELPANTRILEEKEEDSSEDSNSVTATSGPTSSKMAPPMNKQGRFSQEVQNAQIALLRKEFGVNNKYGNSEDSFKGLSTPPLTNQLGMAQQR